MTTTPSKTEVIERLRSHAEYGRYEWGEETYTALQAAIALLGQPAADAKAFPSQPVERADLVELRRLMEAATKGPWGFEDHGVAELVVYDAEEFAVCSFAEDGYAWRDYYSIGTGSAAEKNAAFIVAACNALPSLIAEVERLQGLGAAGAGWQPIETAPKDGTRIILAKIGLTHDTKDHEVGSEEWKRIVFNEKPAVLSVWWATAGSWRKDRWWDGHEPCGLSGPTHWMPVPAVPQTEPSTPPQHEGTPSVAEPAKCGTCKNEGAVYAIHTGWSDCPDCAPASAEQTCVCHKPKPIVICGRPFQASPPHSDVCGCWNLIDGNRCGHAFACHAAADAGKVKVKVKPEHDAL